MKKKLQTFFLPQILLIFVDFSKWSESQGAQVLWNFEKSSKMGIKWCRNVFKVLKLYHLCLLQKSREQNIGQKEFLLKSLVHFDNFFTFFNLLPIVNKLALLSCCMHNYMYIYGNYNICKRQYLPGNFSPQLPRKSLQS